MRLLFAYRGIDNLAGGVERISTAIMNEMCARGHDVHFLTFDEKNARSFYPMDPKLTWHKIDVGNFREKASWGERIKRAVRSRKVVEHVKPEVILAFQDGAFLTALSYSAFSGVPIVFAERVSPQYYSYKENAHIHQAVLYNSARLAKNVTIQCESYKSLYPKFLQHKLVTIPNPVSVVNERERHKSKKAGDAKTILCVGRFSFQKNQRVLIEAFKALQDKFPDWRLVLVGDGEDAEKLEKLSGGNEAITFLPNTEEISSLYQDADIFCLPSRWEGFPNALAEALAHGVPAIGFEDCGGVKDLITQGTNGMLASGADSVESLTTVLSLMMRDDPLRKKMGHNAVESVRKYNPQTIFDSWENLFAKLARKDA